jgi:hypothetical protein
MIRHPIDDVTLPIPTTPQLTEANINLLPTTSMHTLINHIQNRKYTNNIIVIKYNIIILKLMHSI